MTDDRRMTPAQERSVKTIGSNLLVSAAAGTGKTHVLSERCAHWVCDAQPPCDVDRLLVVTFTEAAAAEMRTRIGAAIRERIRRHPGRSRLHRQLALLEAASITTIHAFCRQLVRRWFVRLDLDPNVEVMDDDEAELIRRETMQLLFADLYAAPKGDPLADGFRHLVDTLGDGRDAVIADSVLSLHAFVGSLPNPSTWLANAQQRLAPSEQPGTLSPSMETLRRCLLLEQIKVLGSALVVEAQMVRDAYPSAVDVSGLMDDMVGTLRAWYLDVGNARTCADIDAVLKKIKDYTPELGRARNLDADQKAEREKARVRLNGARARLDRQLKRHLGVFGTSAVIDALNRTRPGVSALTQLVELFNRRYTQAKRAEGRVDFTDLERYALTLLSADAEGTVPSETALQVRSEYDHVLVDEYQDVNRIQEAILRLVSRQGEPDRKGNLFAVGDVKQSIYRFRLAEPDIFIERIAGATQSDTAEGPADSSGREQVIWLQDNFRSRPEVLEAINTLFERMMVPELGGLTYDEKARFKAGAEYPGPGERDFRPPAVEVHLLEKDIEAAEGGEGSGAEGGPDEATPLEYQAIEREAMLVGRRILELTGRSGDRKPMHVYEKNPDSAGPALRCRPIRLRDIVILLRTARHKANHFERILRQMGIGVHADLSTGYFNSLEIREVLSLLRLIDNPRQDIPLAAVLRGPLMGSPMTETELLDIRTASPDAPFHAAVIEYARSGANKEVRRRLETLFSRLADWRERLRREPLADVLWQILSDTGYWAYVGGLRDGPRRRANLVRLHDRARQFGRFARQGLYRFLRFIDQLDKRQRDPGIASPVSEADDVVRIMTIHHSKGLEFPVVILPDLGKRFNLADVRSTMVFDRAEGIGLSVTDVSQGIRYPSLPKLAVADAVARQIRAEEMRVLYVALTRAREHLILVGTTPLAELEEHRRRGRVCSGAIPLMDLLGAGDYLDWLLPALSSMPADRVSWSEDGKASGSGSPLFGVATHSGDAMSRWSVPEMVLERDEASLSSLAKLEAVLDTDAEAPEVKEVIRRITLPYPHSAMSAIPTVMAAGELKRRFALDHESDEWRPEPILGRSAFAEPPQVLRADAAARLRSATEYGTLVHTVIQHLDLSRPCDVQDIAGQADDMVRRGLLTPQDRSELDVACPAWFFSTDLGRRLRQSADRVRRELPLSLRVSPDRVIPGLPGDRVSEDVVLVRGIIDCLLDDRDGFEVVDFKTDAIGRDALADRVARYTPQIAIYAEAVEAIWRRPVSHRWLVFLTLREIVGV